MTLTKHKMIREIGRRTRLKDRDVQAMIETLIDVWTDELVNGGRIELENFLVLEVLIIDRGKNVGMLKNKGLIYSVPRLIRKLSIRPSKKLKRLL